MDLATAKHAFVTGAASGIGLGIARALGRRGIAVTVADIDRDSLDAAVAKVDGRARAQQLDVRDRAAWAAARDAAEAAFGPVDILVNNAGVALAGSELADMDPADYERVIAINLTGVFNGVSAFAGGLRERGAGHIVNTGSMAGLFPVQAPGVADYAASKAAVIALSEVLRAEMAPHGVGVSVLCPGRIGTNLMRNSAKLGGRDFGDADALLQSEVSPDDVGEMVARAITDDAPFIVTHAEDRACVEQRHRGIEAAFDVV